MANKPTKTTTKPAKYPASTSSSKKLSTLSIRLTLPLQIVQKLTEKTWKILYKQCEITLAECAGAHFLFLYRVKTNTIQKTVDYRVF